MCCRSQEQTVCPRGRSGHVPVAENSNRTKTLKCPLNLLSRMSLKTNKSFVSGVLGTDARQQWVGGWRGSSNGHWQYCGATWRWKRKERNRGSKKGLFLRCERLKLVYMLLGRCRTGGDHRTEFLRTRKWEQVEGLDSNKRRNTASTTEELCGK